MYFNNEEKFDLIFCSAVFEHLYMPWVAAKHMAELLKVGGHIFVETHFSHVAHERPWNFFQFSDTCSNRKAKKTSGARHAFVSNSSGLFAIDQQIVGGASRAAGLGPCFWETFCS
tara:strand:+ start:490 stop:834 length:345 start_codon:yes stop_codon:yes gene_type:complete